jgi:hypothetical protein
VVGAISVVVTLAYLARQMKLNTRQMKRAEESTVMAEHQVLRLAVAQDAELARLVIAAEADIDSLDAVSRYRVEQYFIDWIIAVNNYWDRARKGDIDVTLEMVAFSARWRLQTSAGRRCGRSFELAPRRSFATSWITSRSRRRIRDQRVRCVTTSTARLNATGSMAG